MKNLELLELTRTPFNDILEGVDKFTQTEENIYFIENQNLLKYSVKNKTLQCLLTHNFTKIVDIKFITIEKIIFIACADVFFIASPEESKILLETPFDGIEAVQWGPSEESFVLVNSSGEVFLFGLSYDEEYFSLLGSSSVDAIVPDTVYVGWGSTDTQFRGSAGKLKGKQPPVEVKTVEDCRPNISWRGNGEMFVVNYWKDEKRMFVVFDTSCKALFKSNECLGMQPPIAWRPAGNMIAVSVEVNGGHKIGIFEKNGQKRFDFDLDVDPEARIIELKWSPCAQILSIHTKISSISSIYLLTSSNYKWYIKQVLTFTATNPLLHYDFLESPLTLRALTPRDNLTYKFHPRINSFQSTCAVINGKFLQLTDFADAIIPPTLFSKQITNDNPINFVSLRKNEILIVDSMNILKIFDNDQIKLTTQLGADFPLANHHFIFQDSIYFVSGMETCVFKLENGKVNPIAPCDNPKKLIISPPDLVIHNFKEIYQGLYRNLELLPITEVQIADSYVCQLTANCHFYVNDVKICDRVSSFLVFDKYLLFTTKTNELYCSRLRNDVVTGDLSKFYRRNLEQGANIIAAIPNSPTIILQLPRGNLETISCRFISIDILDQLLESSKWVEGVRFIRLEKLNSNLLFDLNPSRFLDNIPNFVKSLSVSELNAIILEFEEGNVLSTMYQNWGRTAFFPKKLRVVFEKMLSYFDETDYVDYITTIMIINLNFFTLKDALAYIQDLLRRDCGKTSAVEAITTLKIYGCDEEKLYSEALALYDLELAHFVASHCQMDPRTYEPHLNDLKSLSEVGRRFEINVYNKRPEVAVVYLLRSDEDPSEILKFMQKHRVAQAAYENCTCKYFEVVSEAFAEELSKKGRHKEAGVVFKRAKLHEKALVEFQLSLDVGNVLDLLRVLNKNPVEVIRVVSELAAGLVKQRKYKEAASAYEYANDYETAVRVLTENCLFKDAIHLAKKYREEDVVNDIVPALIKHTDYLVENIVELKNSFDKYKSRLRLVRELKVQKMNNECDEFDDLYSEVGSVVSTRSSRSRSSTASSRNRRKEERRKQDLREGGVYEDIALMRALHGVVKEIYGKSDDVSSCCLLLMQESEVSYKDVKKVHDLYKETVSSVAGSLGEIWLPHFYNVHLEQALDVRQKVELENFEHLDVEFRRPPSQPLNDWSLLLFK